MNAGNGPAGGGGLLPGAVDHVVPHAGRPLGAFSNPLNAAGAAPALTSFSFHHCAPQKVTSVPVAAFPSPITNVPPVGVAKIRTVQEVVALLPPTSAIETLTV